MNGKLPVSKETFIAEQDPEMHRRHLYDTLEWMAQQQGTFIEKCEGKFDSISKRKIVNTAAAAGGGFVGGVLTVVGKWFFFRGP